MTLLRAIYRSVSSIGPDKTDAKMEWIDGGIFSELSKIVCLHGGQVEKFVFLISFRNRKNQPNEPKEPIKICKRLLEGNPEGCLMLSRVLLTHLRQHVDCVSSYLFVQQVMSVPAFELVFLQNRGAHFLIDFYEKTCVILHGRNYDRSLDFTMFVEAIKDEPSELDRKDQQSSNNSEDQELPLSRGSKQNRIGGHDTRSTNSETGDEESSASGSLPNVGITLPPAGPLQTPRTEKREVREDCSDFFFFFFFFFKKKKSFLFSVGKGCGSFGKATNGSW